MKPKSGEAPPLPQKTSHNLKPRRHLDKSTEIGTKRLAMCQAIAIMPDGRRKALSELGGDRNDGRVVG